MFKQRYTARKKYDLVKMGNLKTAAAATTTTSTSSAHSTTDSYRVGSVQQRQQLQESSSSIVGKEDNDEDTTIIMNRYLRTESSSTIPSWSDTTTTSSATSTDVKSTTALISSNAICSFPFDVDNDNDSTGSLLPTISVTPYSPISPSANTINSNNNNNNNNNSNNNNNNNNMAGKHYIMLEDNLRQLRDIVDSVQQMKDENSVILYASNNNNNNNRTYAYESNIRLSCSCPSLINDPDSDSEMQNNSFNSSPSYKDVSSASLSASHFSSITTRRPTYDCSSSVTNSNHNNNNNNVLNALSSDETLRRKSWSALEDLSYVRQRHYFRRLSSNSKISTTITPTSCLLIDRRLRRNSNNSIVLNQNRKQQRSVSVSSLDSDFVEDPFTDSAVNLLNAIDTALIATSIERRRKSTATSAKNSNNRRSTGTANNNSSTRSLNEADLQKDFDKLKTIQKQRQDESESSSVDGLQTRLPLQKSISTPSILSTANKDASNNNNNNNNNNNSNVKNKIVSGDHHHHHPSGTESETEEEILACLLENGTSPGSINRASLLSYIQDGVYYGTRQEKRQKRGSLFFRRGGAKKDALNNSANWKKNNSNSNSNNNNNVSFIGVSSLNNSLPNDHVSQFNFNDVYSSNNDETPLVAALEFLNENVVTCNDLDTDPFLGLADDEPETWSMTVSKDLLKKMKDKDVKRQEHIYELILTEKHHCLVLKVMQKIFADGLQKYFNLGVNINRMFPRLSDLTDIHTKFLHSLRERQRLAPLVDNIGDLLSELFAGESAVKLKSAYGEFCSRHREAVNIYKHYAQRDPNFAAFVKHCQNNPLLKKKGIPECILFVTQRLTKYPLLIEPLIKTSKDRPDELERLTLSLSGVKEILIAVDGKVAEREKEEKKYEIYNKIDVKSFAYYNGRKFKKSSVLSNNRKLQFEGVATLMQQTASGRVNATKMQTVHVIVMTDILFFLTENNNKFNFFAPYGKEGVISLQKLLVREKAGGDSRGLYLISSTLPNPEMYELKIHKPKEKQIWIRSIRDIVRNCPSNEDGDGDYYFNRSNSNYNANEMNEEKLLTTEEQQHVYLHQLIESLRQKDLEQAITLEEKIALQTKLLTADGVNVSSLKPSYGRLLSDDVETIFKEITYALQRVGELTGSFYNTETGLSRSASSVGEHQSFAYISPLLPKRAETFGGFDNANKESAITGTRNGGGACSNNNNNNNNNNRKLSQQLLPSSSSKKTTTDNQSASSAIEPLKKLSLANFLEEQQLSWKHVLNMVGANFNTNSNNNNSNNDDNNIVGLNRSSQQLPLLLQVDRHAQPILIELTSHMYTLTTIIMKQTTVIEELRTRLKIPEQESYYADSNVPKKDNSKKTTFNHSQQLEELRNLQDNLTREREQWQQQKDAEQKELEEKRRELLRLQEQIRNEQNDITLQREQLYRKLELLTSQTMRVSSDIIIPPSSVISTSPIPDQQQQQKPPSPSSSSDMTKRRSDSIRCKQSNKPTTSTLPLNLISATNQQKVSSTNVQVKQKLPLKLASKLASGGNNSSINTSCSSTANSPLTQQQIIPLKLQQGVAAFTNNVASIVNVESAAGIGLKYSSPLASSSSFGYQRLSSAELSGASPSHSRTGSSPAMMQNTEMSNAVMAEPIGDSNSASNRTAERMNTYPKISDRYKIQHVPVTGSSNVKKPKSTTEQQVIFF